jgi:hypothetical protein
MSVFKTEFSNFSFQLLSLPCPHVSKLLRSQTTVSSSNFLHIIFKIPYIQSWVNDSGVEHIPSKSKALSSNLVPPGKKKKNN